MLMDDRIIKLDNENDEEFIYRICMMKDMIGSWEDVADILNGELHTSYSESKWRKDWKRQVRHSEPAKPVVVQNDHSYLQDIQEERRALEKERKKLQTEKLEYNRWLRENARDELTRDAIIEEVRKCPKFDPPQKLIYDKGNRSACLIIADAHYGTEFQILGLHGEILNAYSPEIFKTRMSKLFTQLLEIIDKEHIEVLNIYSLGDDVDGILRVSQLMKLRYGVIESSVRYANYMATWLNTLSEYVHIRFQTTYGNHSELRMLGQPKGTFKDDNTGLFVKEIIKTRLEDNPNFELIENPTGLIFDNLCGYNILGIHGECKGFDKAIKDFSNTYNTPIDILIGGHYHHYNGENTGVYKEVIGTYSIMGLDDFAMKLQKVSEPGAILFFIEENAGITLDYKIKL